MIAIPISVVCPMCPGGVQHVAMRRIDGTPMAACPSVTPIGSMVFRNTPAPSGVFLVGAGIGVDQEVPREPTDAELRARLALLEQEEAKRKAAEGEAKASAELRAKVAKLEKQNPGVA